jgi:hypothetical protein
MQSKRRDEREEFWREKVARHRASGLSVREFCQRESLREQAFYVWRRRLEDGDDQGNAKPSGAKGKAPQPAFVPMMMGQPGNEAGILIELRDGRVLRVSDSVPVERLVALVRTLEATEVVR